MICSCHDVILYSVFFPKHPGGYAIVQFIHSCTVFYFLGMRCTVISTVCIGWNQCICILVQLRIHHDVTTTHTPWIHSLSSGIVQVVMKKQESKNWTPPSSAMKELEHARQYYKNGYFSIPWLQIWADNKFTVSFGLRTDKTWAILPLWQ